MSPVTLAIPCFNAGATLAGVLEAVAELAPPPEERLLVDDGSTDGCAEMARRRGWRVITHPRNRGLAAARNTALEQAQGELVLFVDADARPHPRLVERLTRGYDDPSLAAVGGQVVEVNRDTLPDRWRALFWRQTQGEEPLRNASFVIGACCSIRRDAALDAGGFSSRFRTNGEDVELSARLRRLGLRLAYDPQAQVYHQRHDDVRGLLSMVFRHSRDQVLGLRAGGDSPGLVVRNALRWGPVTFVSSLRRHRSPGLAALSPLCYAASLAGCALGLTGNTVGPQQPSD